MKAILLSLPIVLLSYFSASSQSYVLRQKDGLKVTVSPEYRSSHKDIFGTDMNMWKMNMSIENLTSDALEFKMNFSFVKYLNGTTGSDEYIYSGRIEPRSLINKSALQATEASCSNCDHLVKFKEWGVTNLTEQQRNQQYAQQQQQYQQQQQQQAYLQQQQAQQAAYQAQLQQQELQRQQQEATQGTILFISDIKVSVNINGEVNEVLEPNTPKPVKVQQGDVLLLITPAAAPDKVKQEVIKVEAQKQIVKNISLQKEFGALEKARIANETKTNAVVSQIDVGDDTKTKAVVPQIDAGNNMVEDPQAAQDYLSKALKAYQEEKNYKKAFEYMERVVYHLPKDTSMLLNAGVYFGPSAEEYDKALSYIDRYHAAGGTNPDSYIQKLNIYLTHKKDLNKALSVTQDLKKKFPQNTDFPKYELDIYVKMNRLPEAKAVLQKMASANLKDVESRYYLGIISKEMKDPVEAKKWFMEALKIDPNHADSLAGLAGL